MNNLTTKIKISVVFSLIAAGLVLSGCASRSAKSAATDTAASSATAAASDATAASTAAAQTSASVTGGIEGAAPITYADLMALQAKGTQAGTPIAQ